jgi:galactokinase
MKSIKDLQDIKDKIVELVNEADRVIRSSKDISPLEKERWRAYPKAHLMCALDSDHDYFGGSMFTFQSIIDNATYEDEG